LPIRPFARIVRGAEVSNMRAMQWALGLGAALTMGGALATGCGSSDNNNPPADSGGDVVTDHSIDVAADVGNDAPADAAGEACAVDADITSYPIPDGDIPDTNLPISGCVTCFENACPAAVTMCDMSCSCKVAFAQFEMCFAQGMSLITCGQILLNAGISIQMLTCALPCASSCGVMPGMDGGGDSGGDASVDSGDDGPADAGPQ
jgi:hypothetical protein